MENIRHHAGLRIDHGTYTIHKLKSPLNFNLGVVVNINPLSSLRGTLRNSTKAYRVVRQYKVQDPHKT